MATVPSTHDERTRVSRRVAVPNVHSVKDLCPLPGRDRLVVLGGDTMGTTWSAHLYAPQTFNAAMATARVQSALDLVVAEMSPWEANSTLSRFNAAPAGAWLTLSPHFAAVLKTSLDVARDTAGAFDPTIGSVVNAWGFGPAYVDRLPPIAVEGHERALSQGWRALKFDIETGRVRQPGGLVLDFCGIAKGYGVDLAARSLRSLGVRDFLIEVGGELKGEGVKPDGSPWWVELELPIDEGRPQQSDLVAALHGAAIATSGDYQRFVLRDGHRYSHTIDPMTGRPLTNGVASVTVIHKSCMCADALATALTVMGPEKALEFSTSHGIAARLLIRSPQGLAEIVTPVLQTFLDA